MDFEFHSVLVSCSLPAVQSYFGMRFLRSRYSLAVIAGLLLAAAFPLPGVAGFAWVGPGLLAAAALGKGAGDSFRIGYAGGFTYYAASLYWLLMIPYRWHGVPVGPAFGWVALSAYMACYPAVWVWLLNRARGLHFPPRETGEGETQGRVWAGTWARRALWAVFGAALWVSLEMLAGWLFTGFPWNPLGASQYRLVPLIQVASVTGIYGVSFLVVWMSLSLVSAGLMLLQHPGRPRAFSMEILMPMVTVAGLFSLGFSAIRSDPPPNRHVSLTLIQPSIPQTLIWDASSAEARFADLLRLSERALSNRTDILIWPEAAVPKLLRYDQETFDAVTGLARKYGVWMIIGADDAEPVGGDQGRNQAEYYNSSFLISPHGELAAWYRKQRLVIFGEYVPLANWLPFLRYFTPIEGGFTPGAGPVRFQMPELGVTAAVLICFEDTFPAAGRAAGRVGPDFLLNLTNDGWFGASAAPWQHAITAVFRAVENRLPLVRCANNGVTCWVDARGRLREVFRDVSGGVYGPGYARFNLPISGSGNPGPRTFYARNGDLFGFACAGFSILSVVGSTRGRRVHENPAQ